MVSRFEHASAGGRGVERVDAAAPASSCIHALTRGVVAAFLCVLAILGSVSEGRAQNADFVPPPIKFRAAQYFNTHPEAWRQLLARLPRRAVAPTPTGPQPVAPTFGGSWTALPAAPSSGLSNPLLLTDGTVIVHVSQSETWYKLTPDANGNYATGTWSQIASLPSGYGPLYFASAVLPDGRVIMEGGEYNESCPGTETWTSLGAIYDPVANVWNSVSPPSGSGWTNTEPCSGRANGGVGDAASVVLPNGAFLLSACCAFPDADAVLNATNLTYSSANAPAGASYQDEQGYTLLQNDHVLTIDVWNTTHAEEYDPGTGAWSYVASTPISLVDPSQCGNFEIGPAVTRPDGTTVAFGGNTGCTTSPADPTAIFTASSNSWVQGPDVPQINGAYFDLADAPAAMLPNGNILFGASPGYGQSPTHFFEFTSATSSPANSISQVADPLFNASSSGGYYYNFLVLPNGQIFMTDFSSVAEVYTPTGSPNPAWAPTISSSPTTLVPGQIYSLSGTQLNGLSQGAAYGDDIQGATNYPLVRITNNSTGHVFYAKTFNFSTMSIAPGAAGSTSFAPPSNMETGASTLVVVANGVPSQPVSVNVTKSAAEPLTASITGGGTVTSSPAGISCAPICSNNFAAGAQVSLTASAATGWSFSGWSGAGCSGTGACNVTMNAAESVTATFTQSPALQASGPTIFSSGVQGGPFSPASFSYTLSATSGAVGFSVSNVPSWLTPSATSGTTPATVTFSVNANANGLPASTYSQSIAFTNTTNGAGDANAPATLVVASSASGLPQARTFVSSKGTDSGNCARAAPCRSFAYALSQTVPHGEIDVLDTAGYGAATITQSVSIVNPGGVEAGVAANSGATALTIAAGPNDVVALRGLTIEGLKSGENGVLLTSGGTLEMDDCVVRDFAGDAIALTPSGSTLFRLSNVVAIDNGQDGVLVRPQGSGSAKGVLDHVTANDNGNDGIAVAGDNTTGGAVFVAVSNSVASDNGHYGLYSFSGSALSALAARRVAASDNLIGFYQSGSGGIVELGRSAATANNYGVVVGGGLVDSFGDNAIGGNASADVSGGLTSVGASFTRGGAPSDMAKR